MNNRGQMAMWEALIIIVLMGFGAYMTFLWAKKPSENSIYQAGSKPVVTDLHCAPLSCCSDQVDSFMEAKHASIVNTSHP